MAYADIQQGGWSRRRKLGVAAAVVAVLLFWPWQPKPASTAQMAGFRLAWKQTLGPVLAMTSGARLMATEPEVVVTGDQPPMLVIAFRLDPDSGRILGERQLLQRGPEASPAADLRRLGDHLLLQSLDRTMRLIRLADLAEVWTQNLEYVWSSARRGDELVVVTTDLKSPEVSLVALRMEDGSKTMLVESIPAGHGYGEMPWLKQAGDHILLIAPREPLRLVASDGKLRPLNDRSLENCSVTVSGDAIFVGDATATVECFALDDLQRRWVRSVDNVKGVAPPDPLRLARRPLVMGTTLLMTIDQVTRELVTLDPLTGVEQWRKAMPEKPFGEAIVAVDRGFVVPTCQDWEKRRTTLRWLDEQTGEELGNWPLPRVRVRQLGGLQARGSRVYWADGERTVWCWELVRPPATPPAP